MTVPVSTKPYSMIGFSTALAVSLNAVATLFPHANVLRTMGTISWLLVIGGFLWLIWDIKPWRRL